MNEIHVGGFNSCRHFPGNTVIAGCFGAASIWRFEENNRGGSSMEAQSESIEDLKSSLFRFLY